VGYTVATGVPKKARQRVQVNGSAASEPAYALHLDYPGKRTKGDILARDAANLTCAWQGDGSPVNRLYFAENAGVLAGLAADPAVCGKVRLVYIDPPFATQTAFHSRKLDHAYEDLLSGADYIERLREQLILLHRLLADDGALYLHLDDKMVFHMKIILDEIFGTSGYRTCITRKKCNPKNYTRKQYGNVTDYILFYSKSDSWVWNRPVEAWTEERTKEYQYVDTNTGRRFMKVPVHAPGIRRGETGGLWRGKLPPPGKHWQYTPRTLDEMDARGEIYWSTNGNPRRKVYLDESAGVGVQDIWLEFRDAHNQNICITGYPTEKNPALLKRIIEASSNPGDLVLDCFAGSGTTLAVADQLGRRWIGVDSSPEALRTMLKRFAEGTERMGDFIGVRGAKLTTPDLLAPIATETSGLNLTSNGHRPIRNFDLWIDPELAHQAAPVLQDWQKRMGSPLSDTVDQPALTVWAAE
jgi:adenine-specific DNA-methyltransferase